MYKSPRVHLVALFLCVGLLWASPAQAAVFSPQQVESLLQLLKAFSADAALVERVSQTLGAPTTATPAVPASPTPTTARSASPSSSFRSPSWMKGLVMYEMRLETFAEVATDGNYFKVAMARLPELADLGITAVSINPIGQGQGPVPNLRYRVLYGPSQPDKLDPQLGSDADFARFVAEAHRLGIKVIVDNVVHGIAPSSPYVSGPNALPAHFFVRAADGSVVKTWWGTAQWNWSSVPLRQWWVQNLGVAWVEKYDVDGFRLDLVPDISPIELWNEFKSGIVRETGKDIMLMPEMSPTTRASVFDVGQFDTGISVGHGKPDFYNGTANVVDTVKRSSHQFYSSQISSHDSRDYNAKGRLGAFAYGAIISPYLPGWFMGEEFNAKIDKGSIANTPAYVANGSLYMSRLHWAEKTQNKTLYDQVKKLIQIRKEYVDIIAPGEAALKDTRITKVTRYSGVDLEPYTMWRGTTSITVVAKRATPAGNATFSIPVDVMGMQAPTFTVTELLSGTVVEYTRAQVLQGISMYVPQGGVVVVKAEGVGEPLPEVPAVEKPVETGTVRTQNRLPSGYFERASCTSLEGWVVDPDSPNDIASVRLYKDGPSTSGTLIGTYPTDVLRNDVTAQRTTITGLVVGKHGFAVPLSAALKDGKTHRIYAYGIDNETGALRELVQSPRTVTCDAPAVPQPVPAPAPAPVQPPTTTTPDKIPHGYLDLASCTLLAGWAYDPDQPAASITVHVYDGSVAIGGYKADYPRSDVNRVVGIAGDHGFRIPLPERLKDGKPHTLHFYGINTNSQGKNKELVYSPRTITCGSVSSLNLPTRSLVAAVATAPFSFTTALLAKVLYILGLY